MKGYGTKTFGRLNAGRYDAMYEDLMSAETLDSVETLAELAGGGRVLELAIGTGRVALPLAARGLSVHGIEASEAMVAALRGKFGGSAIPVEIGDMAQVRVKGTFDLIYLVFNTIFNLTDPGSSGALLQERRGAPERQGGVRRGDGRARFL
jgi:SAM-dependent methyltransferase